jgi:hypothetical protein
VIQLKIWTIHFAAAAHAMLRINERSKAECCARFVSLAKDAVEGKCRLRPDCASVTSTTVPLARVDNPGVVSMAEQLQVVVFTKRL